MQCKLIPSVDRRGKTGGQIGHTLDKSRWEHAVHRKVQYNIDEYDEPQTEPEAEMTHELETVPLPGVLNRNSTNVKFYATLGTLVDDIASMVR